MEAETRRAQLLAEFRQIDTDHDYTFNRQDLYRYLDRRNGGLQFDRHIANELFDKMEKTKDDKVTSDEYFNIWSECHQILNRRIRDDEFDLQNAQDRKSKLENQVKILQQNRGAQQPSLRLIIRESKSIDSELYTIAVRCAGQIRQTNNVSGRNAIVGQFLEFPADKSVQGNIIFQLIDVGNPNKPPLEGTYPIALLADQLKHDEWVVLNRMDGLRSDARLYVTFQHIWSEAEYFKGLIGYWDTFIAQKRADIEKCKADKIKLDTPNDFLMTVAYGDFYIQRLKPTQSLGSTHGMDSAYTNEVMKNPSRTHPLASLASIFGFVLFIACLLLFWYRAAFDTMAIALLLIGFFYLQLDFSTKSCLFLLILTFVAIVMDITWLILYQGKFWNTAYIDDNTFQFGRKFEVVVVWVILILKALTMLLLFRLYVVAQRSGKNFPNIYTQGIPMGNLYNPYMNQGYNLNPYNTAPTATGYYRYGGNNWAGSNNEGFFLERPGAALPPNASMTPGPGAFPPNMPNQQQPIAMPGAQPPPVAPMVPQGVPPGVPPGAVPPPGAMVPPPLPPR